MLVVARRLANASLMRCRHLAPGGTKPAQTRRYVDMTTIQLHDLRQAVLEYLNTVLVTTVQQVQPAPNSPGSINPNEIGTFSVKVDNTGDDASGVPLINLRHHFKFDAD